MIPRVSVIERFHLELFTSKLNIESIKLQRDLSQVLPFLICVLANASLHLDHQTIPPNGVVIFSDIGGDGTDGLYCAVNDSSVPFGVMYWTLPNGQTITNLADLNEFGIDRTCHYLDHCVSLYYEGKPPERGQFMCVTQWETQPTISYARVPVNVVDMTVSKPAGPILASAGDNIELSVNVTVTPSSVSVPYQWQLNETD